MARGRRGFAQVAACLAVVVTGIVGPQAHATPGRSQGPPLASSYHGPTLADRDGNEISDRLDRRLARSVVTKRLDVVATFSGRRALRRARAALPAIAHARTFSLIPGFAATLTKHQIESLARRPGVVRVEEDFAVHALDDAANRDFGATAAQNDFQVTGQGTEVCVVDTGVDPGHEQLDSKSPIPFLDLIHHETTAYDDMGHGTHVASIAVGDGVGPGPIAGLMKGVAPDADLSAVKVLDSTGNGDDSLGVLGIQWCADRPSVDVISLSLGSDVPSDGLDGLSKAVDAAVLNKGKIVVAAAGNNGDLPGTIQSPGSAVQAITVGAAAEWSAPASYPYASQGPYLAPFSSRGPTADDRVKPDVVAPGVSIGAADYGTTSGYIVLDGTSMATPYVSGTALLIRQLQPTWTQTDVRSALDTTALHVGTTVPNNDWGYGLVDAYGAVAAADGSPGQTPFPTYRHFSGTVSDSGVYTKSFTLGAGDLGAPIAATITIDGSPVCTIDLGPLGCLLWEWSPDLDAKLLGPNGFSIAKSTCANGEECVSGHQETLHYRPTVAGTYTIKVAPAAGAGGSFSIDLFTGPVASSSPPSPTVHVGDIDGASKKVPNGWRATATVTVLDENNAAVAGAVVTGVWNKSSVAVTCTTGPAGRCSIGKKFPTTKLKATFTVNGVSLAGSAYIAADNVDPDGSSNGTTITISKPS